MCSLSRSFIQSHIQQTFTGANYVPAPGCEQRRRTPAPEEPMTWRELKGKGPGMEHGWWAWGAAWRSGWNRVSEGEGERKKAVTEEEGDHLDSWDELKQCDRGLDGEPRSDSGCILKVYCGYRWNRTLTLKAVLAVCYGKLLTYITSCSNNRTVSGVESKCSNLCVMYTCYAPPPWLFLYLRLYLT